MNYTIHRTQISWVTKNNTSERTARLIRWLHDHCVNKDLSTSNVGELLIQPNGKKYSGDSVYQAITGRRTEKQLPNFLEAVERLEKIEREKATITRVGFIETNLTKKIWKICDSARNFGKIMFIIGRSHIGKTTALQEYTKMNNHGATLYIRIPAGGTLGPTLYELCKALNLTQSKKGYEKKQIVIDAINQNMVLIIDEAHQLLHTRQALHTLEYLREVHDRTGCGLVISATEIFQDELENGENSKMLSQLKMRSLIQAKLPDRPSLQNLKNFAAHFGLPAAQNEALDLQNDIIDRYSLGRWLSILEGASRIASKKQQTMTWEHVLQSHAALLNLERGD